MVVSPVLLNRLALALTVAAAVVLMPGVPGDDRSAFAVALGFPVLVAVVPVAAVRSRALTALTWTAALVLLAWSAVAAASVGLFVLPAALVELWAALRTRRTAAVRPPGEVSGAPP
jgi:hypothetical protein